MKILFCMASKESAANLNPLQAVEIRPDLVVVVITKTMEIAGQHLITEIKATGLKVEAFRIEHESSLIQLNQQFEQFLEQYFEENIIVNLTGGTKLMALAAYQVFAGYGFRCFYQDYKTDEIIWLDDESRISDHKNKIRLERYLKAYQFDVVSKETLADISKQHKHYVQLLSTFLAKNFEKNVRFVSKLNAHASERSLPKEELKKVIFDQDEAAFLNHLSYETGIFSLSGDTIRFETEQDRILVAGKWIEVLAADALRQVEQTRDISIGVNIVKSTQRVSAKTFQELDVMAMYLQKLLLVECKTVNWRSATEASGAIYKLTALGQIGGLNTKACFISLYDLPAAAKTRAAENNVHIICGKNILQMVVQLNQWVIN